MTVFIPKKLNNILWETYLQSAVRVKDEESEAFEAWKLQTRTHNCGQSPLLCFLQSKNRRQRSFLRLKHTGNRIKTKLAKRAKLRICEANLKKAELSEKAITKLALSALFHNFYYECLPTTNISLNF